MDVRTALRPIPLDLHGADRRGVERPRGVLHHDAGAGIDVAVERGHGDVELLLVTDHAERQPEGRGAREEAENDRDERADDGTNHGDNLLRDNQSQVHFREPFGCFSWNFCSVELKLPHLPSNLYTTTFEHTCQYSQGNLGHIDEVKKINYSMSTFSSGAIVYRLGH